MIDILHITSTFGETKLFSDSYNVGDIFNEIIDVLIKDYKDFVRYEI